MNSILSIPILLVAVDTEEKSTGETKDTKRKETTMASKLNNVLYLAVIRVDGQCIVASYGQPKYESTVNRVVNAAAFRSKVGTGRRIRLVTKEGVAVNFTGGAQGLAVLAITTASYPDRIAFSGLIEDTTQRFLSKGFMWSSSNKDGFTRKFKSDMSELCKEYDDVQSKDKISTDLHTIQNNITKALEKVDLEVAPPSLRMPMQENGRFATAPKRRCVVL